jgi:predicted ATP-grasp superfamily ATP-dependent carboligase
VPRGTLTRLNKREFSTILTEKLLNLPVSWPSLLMGVNEDIIRCIYENREKLSKRYVVPENEYSKILDKYEFNRILPDLNRIPTYLAKKIEKDSCPGDGYILKGRRGSYLRNLTGKKAIHLKDLNAKLDNLIKRHIQAEDLIVQKLIESESPVVSYCSFSIKGDVFGEFQYEKIRQHPNRFGTGTYLQSVKIDEIGRLGRSILSRLKYTGISEIEFILDSGDKQFKVIEMNPRTWKSINFATQCGQNLVEKYVHYILGKDVKKGMYYKVANYWVDLCTDIPQMFREKKMFTFQRENLFECLWDRDDPVPFFAAFVWAPFLALKI